MPRVAWPIVLDPKTEKELWRLARAPSSPQAVVLRAKIILAAAQGPPNQQIASNLGVTANTVTKWRNRFRMFGIQGLTNWGHGGRTRKYGPEIQRKLRWLLRHPPPRSGQRWTYDQLAWELNVPRSTAYDMVRAGDFYNRHLPARRGRR